MARGPPHLLVSDGGFRRDRTFRALLPLHDVATLTEALRRAVLRLCVHRGHANRICGTPAPDWRPRRPPGSGGRIRGALAPGSPPTREELLRRIFEKVSRLRPEGNVVWHRMIL